MFILPPLNRFLFASPHKFFILMPFVTTPQTQLPHVEGVVVHVKNFSLLSAFLCELLLSGQPNAHDPEGFKPEASRIAELCVTTFQTQMAHLGSTPLWCPHKASLSTRKRWIRSPSSAFYYMLSQNSRKLPEIKRGLTSNKSL